MRLHSRKGHFLQSAAWHHFQEALGFRVLFAESPTWQWIGSIQPGRRLTYLYVSYGPTVSSVDSTGEALESARAAAQSHGIDVVRCDPAAPYTAAIVKGCGGREVDPVQPRHTWVLNLEPEEAELRKGLSSGHRGTINAAPRKGITFTQSREPHDVTTFLELLHMTTAHRGFESHPDAYYTTLCEILMPLNIASLYFARADGRAVAGAIAFDFGDVRYYAHAATDPGVARTLNPGAPLVWQMVCDAKGQGLSSFDFWGIAPPNDPTHRWAGLSQFKKAFGGTAIERIGTWDIPISKAKYSLHTLARRVFS